MTRRDIVAETIRQTLTFLFTTEGRRLFVLLEAAEPGTGCAGEAGHSPQKTRREWG